MKRRHQAALLAALAAASLAYGWRGQDRPAPAIVPPRETLPQHPAWRPGEAPAPLPPPPAGTIAGRLAEHAALERAKTAAPARTCVWKSKLRDLAAAVALPTARADTCICPPQTSDLDMLANVVSAVHTTLSLVQFATMAGNLFGGTKSALGDQGGGQGGSPAMPLPIPVPDLRAVLAIPNPGGPVPPPTLSTVAGAAGWVASAFTPADTTAAAQQAVAGRRDAAALEAARYGYALAVQQRSAGQVMDRELAATANLGNAATAIGQAGGLANTANTLVSDTQHLQALEEAALELEAAEAMRTAPQP